MLKVLVFDSGWGGELFADYLENEIGIIDVIRVIDWHNSPHEEFDEESLRALTEYMICPYIGRVDIIVLASYVVTEATLDWLRERYPGQKFLGFEIRLFSIIHANYSKRILIASSKFLLNRPKYLMAKRHIESVYGIQVIPLDCHEWTKLIDNGNMTDIIIRQTLKDYDWRKDIILLYNTHYLDIKPRLEELFGWRVQVEDDFAYMLRQVYRALRLNHAHINPTNLKTCQNVFD